MIDAITPDVDPAALRKARDSTGLVSAATAALAAERKRESETLSDFVDKKREMFLVQMSLDIKAEEMSKLDATARAHEAELKKAEMALEADAVRFDAFLKDTDAAAHEAVKRAEGATKAKADKQSELKRLRHGIAAVTAEKARLRDALDEYRRYKDFLDSLTPAEWVAERRAEQLAERRRRQAAALAARTAEWAAARAAKHAEVTARVDAERKRALKLGQQLPRVDVEAVVNESVPPAPLLADEPLPELTEEERELPMYFVKPGQLGAIFAQLEASNLFLIQNCQDTEQQLEELRARQVETAAALEAQTRAGEEQMAGLLATLAAEEAKAAALRKRGSAAEADAEGGGGGGAGGGGAGAGAGAGRGGAAGAGDAGEGGGGGGGGGAGALAAAGVPSAAAAAAAAGGPPLSHARALDALLPALRAYIVGVYEKCGFKANASSDTVGMLTQLEATLEGLLTAVAGLEPEYVAAKERERERERRTRVREARLARAATEHLARQRKMLERAQAPVAKRVGKPVMYRSILPARPNLVVEADPEEVRRLEEARFFS